jgi:hypothetical protein
VLSTTITKVLINSQQFKRFKQLKNHFQTFKISILFIIPVSI